jgi:hypothetical protein
MHHDGQQQLLKCAALLPVELSILVATAAAAAAGAATAAVASSCCCNCTHSAWIADPAAVMCCR